MPYPSASAVEIDRKLRDDFRKRLKEYGVSADVTDPILAVLFRTFAQQLEVLYSDTEHIRLALLDELISGLGLEKRAARPAQAVIRFSGATGSMIIEAGTALSGESQTGAKLGFATDESVTVSDARLCFGATYEEGALRLMSGIDMPDNFLSARPSLEPVKTNLGPNPALYFAIQPPSAGNLSGHGFYFDLTPDAREIQEALARETWCLASPRGEFSAAGILRPAPGNAGLRNLRWLISPAGAVKAESQGEPAILPPGFYAGKVFVMPVIPSNREFGCRTPRAMEGALARIFGREAQELFQTPRVWVKITLPKGLPALHTNISSLNLHAITASNVECLNQTVYFERHGTSIPISKEGGTNWHLVAPLSVISESDTPYLSQTEPSTDPNVGRYVVRNGRIELTPARWPNGKPHTYANIRVWTSAAVAGNQVGPGKISSIQLTGGAGTLRVTNVTSGAGGAGSEEFAEAQARFSSALLSRDRVVTRADLFAVVKSFDRRIVDATIRSGLDRDGGALRRVERVTLHLRKSDFIDPEIEVRYLVEDLTAVLERRFIHDTGLSVQVAWEEP